MVKERFESAQEAFPEQFHCYNSCETRATNRCGKEKSFQNGTSQVQKILEDPWQVLSCKDDAAEVTLMQRLIIFTGAVVYLTHGPARGLSAESVNYTDGYAYV